MHVTTKSDKELNRQYHECEALGIPWVHVEPQMKYASVSWDCRALPQYLRDSIDYGSEAVAQSLLEIFKRYRTKRSTPPCYSIEAGTFHRLSLSDAELAAEEIFNLLMSMLPTAVEV